jgi:hypothetical protein
VVAFRARACDVRVASWHLRLIKTFLVGLDSMLATLVLVAAASVANSCTTPADCALAGVCNAGGRCVCDPGFAGADCSQLDVSGEASTTIAGLPGAVIGADTVGTVWGGHTLVDDAGARHWYGSAIIKNGTLLDWATSSAAAHAVDMSHNHGNGVTSTEPLRLSSIVVHPSGDRSSWYGGSVHGVYLVRNPRPWPNGTDQWLLYFTGFTVSDPLAHRAIGVAYSSSLSGDNWTVWPVPVLTANHNATAVDSSSVSNPAPAFDRDGSGRLLLAYKGLGKAAPGKPVCTDGSGHACISVAEAPHWTGPYRHVTADAGFKLLGEDPTMWQDTRGNWHMIYEHYNEERTFSGRHAFSATGTSDWHFTNASGPRSAWGGFEVILDGAAGVTLTHANSSTAGPHVEAASGAA